MNLTKEKRATFTPGPWMIQDAGPGTIRGLRFRVITDEKVIAKTSDGLEEARANARLIAAAPAMYEVLQEILAPCPVKGYLGKYDHRRTYNARKKAREVLAKVEGGEG